MLDQQTGCLILTPAIQICADDSLETVVAMSLGESSEIRDMGTGWVWLTVQNMPVQSNFYSLGFGFYNDKLRMISLSFTQERAEKTGDWSLWSESDEMEKLEEYKRWLCKELGREERFAWGTATADYDRKDASADITIHYNN